MFDYGYHMVILGIASYFILMLAIGLYSGKKIKTSEDYLVANRKLPFFLAVPTIIATWFGAGTCLGVSGMVYEEGLSSVIADPFATSIGLIIAGIFFAYHFRKLKLLTIADILGKTYGKPLEIFGGILMLPIFIGTLASQMLAMGYIFNIATNAPAEIGIVIGSLTVLIYTLVGGMWAVSITDFIQMTFILASLFILLVMTFGALSSVEPIIHLASNELNMLKPQEISFDYLSAYFGQFLMTGFGAIMGQDLIQRFLSCKTANVAKYSAISAGFIYLLLGCIPIFIGLAGRSIYPHLENGELLIPLLASNHLSSISFAIFATGLLSAIMSTADSYLLAGSSILTQNIFFPLFPKLPKQSPIFFIRICNVVIVMVAFSLAMISESIFNLMVHSGVTLFVSIFVPVTAALYWKKASLYPISAWCAMLFGLLSWLGWIFLRFNSPNLSHEQLLYSAATIGGVISLVSFMFPIAIKNYFLYVTFKKSRQMKRLNR